MVYSKILQKKNLQIQVIKHPPWNYSDSYIWLNVNLLGFVPPILSATKWKPKAWSLCVK